MEHFDRIARGSESFRMRLEAVKTTHPVEFGWYPYDTMGNFGVIASLMVPEVDSLFSGGKRFADIGAADGALAYYLESFGNSVDIYDYGPTNYNGLRGARCIKERLNSSVQIHEIDLDAQFSLRDEYDFVFFLGILYHLKNPFYILEALAKRVRYMAVSTRVVRHFKAKSPDVSGHAAAYLVGPAETNNDATNYWMFTDAGLKQLFARTGWDVLAYCTIGDKAASNPQDPDHDERAFALLKSSR